MEINYNVVSLIDTLGLIQGVILGLLLIIINRKRDKSTLFLGLFIIVYALNLLPAILEDLNITTYYPRYNLLPFDFTWLMFPLFYIYVQQVSILSKNKLNYGVLIPGVLEFIIGIVVFFQDNDSKIIIEESLWYNLVLLGGVLFSFYIGFKTLNFIKKHTKELKDQYTSTEYRELRWARGFVGFGLLLTFIAIASEFFDTGFYLHLTLSTINVMLLYWISVRGILQQNVKTLIPIEDSEKTVDKNDKNNGSLINNESTIQLLQEIKKYIQDEKVYTIPDLTIIDIAEKIGAHPKRISGVINSQLNQNFNSYINSFRVKKAKELLRSDIANSLSVEGIGNEVGFQSKSTFYDAFRKYTGTTPSRFKNDE
ncbi:helix-turn-helix domain-containing protein [Aquimarina megaterium]|uniref:helix-turn-helix domain-containing protein n=1 Tax=Aquimarina megaterium TaxID=1443666 RepID=UPI000470F51F|nr:AraC family transcriptional regulator [Aquimarina megaterium]